MKTIIITITVLFSILWACSIYSYVKINRYVCHVDAPDIIVIDTFNGRAKVVRVSDIKVSWRLW